MSKAPALKGTRLRTMYAVTRFLQATGLFPTVEQQCRMPLAKRLRIKPAAWMTYPIPASVGIRIDSIPGRGGPIPTKCFLPETLDRAAPCTLFIHGGGWVAGGYDSLDYLCANVCASLGATVVAIEYRLAPEHPFPAALEDCVDALAWIAQHHADFGSERSDVAVMGDSAGGNLSAALCLHARDHAGPRIPAQVLIYPTLDASLQSPSIDFDIPGLARKDMETILRAYAPGMDVRNPLLSPLAASDVSRLPPTLILTGDYDTLRDDGARYAERLRAAGVPVRYLNYAGMPHGFFSLAKLCADAPRALAEVVQFLGMAIKAQAQGAA